ncbi:MAG: hypothetical protein MUF83_17275 [Acidimicrobiales bacterium]|jgi:hypothetical protein|nr:hypothetical protein [Acidimicrobiales bacterium]
MRRTLIGIAAAALLFVPVSTGSAGARTATPATLPPETDVYVVHGLNLDGQATADAGGTAVTVCVDGSSLLEDFQFGVVAGPVALPSDVAVSVQVYLGAVVDCAAPGDAPLVIDQQVTPTGAAVSLVATSNGEQLDPELVPIPLDVSCVEPGTGRAVAVHTANAPEVDVVNIDLGVSVGTISYGEQISGPLPVGTYGIEVYVVGGAVMPITSFDVTVEAGKAVPGFAVGNQPGEGGATPIVLIPQEIDVGFCAPPPDTTLAPTSATTATTAQPATSAPTYTG